MRLFDLQRTLLLLQIVYLICDNTPRSHTALSLHFQQQLKKHAGQPCRKWYVVYVTCVHHFCVAILQNHVSAVARSYCGPSDYTDSDGQVWTSRAYITNGASMMFPAASTSPITGAGSLEPIYQSECNGATIAMSIPGDFM